MEMTTKRRYRSVGRDHRERPQSHPDFKGRQGRKGRGKMLYPAVLICGLWVGRKEKTGEKQSSDQKAGKRLIRVDQQDLSAIFCSREREGVSLAIQNRLDWIDAAKSGREEKRSTSRRLKIGKQESRPALRSSSPSFPYRREKKEARQNRKRRPGRIIVETGVEPVNVERADLLRVCIEKRGEKEKKAVSLTLPPPTIADR